VRIFVTPFVTAMAANYNTAVVALKAPIPTEKTPRGATIIHNLWTNPKRGPTGPNRESKRPPMDANWHPKTAPKAI